MRSIPCWMLRIAAFGGILFSVPVWAGPVLGQIDTFSSSAQGWTNGAPAPDPVVISSGGPGGAGDSFLQITANSSGAGGRLTAFNRSQWAGNFVSAGVNAIEMDLKNFGSSPLSIRVALKSGTGIGAPGFASTTPFSLPVDGLWHRTLFLLDADDLTRIGSTTLTLDALLSNVAEFRVLNSAAPNLNGDPIVSQLGVDNIRAVAAVPEPSARLLLASTLGLLFWLKRFTRLP